MKIIKKATNSNNYIVTIAHGADYLKILESSHCLLGLSIVIKMT